MISTADPSINFSSQNNFDFPPVRRQNWVMIENANSSDDANEEIIALLVMLDERDAEIARLRERVRWLEFTPERAAERIKERTHPALAPFKAERWPSWKYGTATHAARRALRVHAEELAHAGLQEDAMIVGRTLRRTNKSPPPPQERVSPRKPRG